LEKAAIFLPPPLMVERNVLGSNWMIFLDAATSDIIGPLSELRMRRRQLPVERMNESAGRREQRHIAGQNLLPTRQNKDFTVDVESQRPARTNGRKHTAAPQVVKNRHSTHWPNSGANTQRKLVQWPGYNSYSPPGRCERTDDLFGTKPSESPGASCRSGNRSNET